MPRRLPTPCSQPGCPEVCYGRFCDEHQRDEYRRQDARRGTAAERGYDAKWRRVRAQYLKHHPLCEECGEPAVEVHHKIPLAQGGTHKWENLKALCKRHHSAITMRDSVER